MIGIDTNVLVRYILDDDPIWSPKAQAFIDDECSAGRPGFINLIVLAELVWVLKQIPGWGKPEICTVISGLLLADNLVLERPELVADALAAYEKGKADFPDALIAAINLSANASPTFTIDKDASKQAGFAKLPGKSRP